MPADMAVLLGLTDNLHHVSSVLLDRIRNSCAGLPDSGAPGELPRLPAGMAVLLGLGSASCWYLDTVQCFLAAGRPEGSTRLPITGTAGVLPKLHVVLAVLLPLQSCITPTW